MWDDDDDRGGGGKKGKGKGGRGGGGDDKWCVTLVLKFSASHLSQKVHNSVE